MIIESKKTGAKMEVSDETWANYGKEGLQANFRVTRKDASPSELTEEKPAVVAPKKLGRTSGEGSE